MAKQIKELFDKNLDHIKIDRSFIKDLKELRVEFMNRNEDHLEFFTSNLIGVNPIKYKSSDRDNWFDEIIEIDEADLKPGLKDIKTIDPSWVRANDLINLSSIYILHRIYNSDLSPKDKEKGMMEVCLLLQYKFLSSLLWNFFRYRADKEVAIATYEALSRKFDIKQQGSWQGLLEHRSKNIIDRHGIHYKTYSTMNDDQGVINMITDIQDRLRNIVKKQKDVFDRVREQNLRISSTKTVVEFDGEKEILDRTRDHTAYTRYLKDIIADKPTFIREELIDIITDALHTVNKQYLLQALEYCSDNYGKHGDKNVEKLIDESLLHVYRYLSDNDGIMQSSSDIGGLVIKLKNLYLASRMSDDQLLKMRDLSNKIIKRSVSSRNKAALASVRTGLQLYIVLRAFAKKYYQGSV